MNYIEHFKPEDIPEARAEVKCIEDLLQLIFLNVKSGKIEQANNRATELLNSLKRINKLNGLKRSDDSFKSVLQQIQRSNLEHHIRSILNER